jgi:hypothetical protein
MTHVEATMFARIICGMYAVHTAKLGEQGRDDMAIAYQLALHDVANGDAMAALQRHAKSSRFVPTPAEIRSEIVAMRLGRARKGIEAWGDVVEAKRSCGHHDAHGSLTMIPVREFSTAPTVAEFMFADPLVHDVVAVLGWRDLVDSESVASDRARFAEIYDERAADARKEATIASPEVLRTIGAPAQPQLAAGRKTKP